jgi:hypothetical protein
MGKSEGRYTLKKSENPKGEGQMKKMVMLISVIVVATFLAVQSYAASPIALWLFNDGAGEVAVDSTGNGYDGTLRNSPTWGEGRFGGGIWFSAAAGSNVIAPVPYLNTLTITMWGLYTNLASNNIGLIHVQAGEDENADPGSKIIGMWVENTSIFWGRIIPVGVGNVNFPKNATVPADEWNHFAMVIDASTGKATEYLNGEAVGEVDYAGELTEFTFINIGRQGNESWEGGIDEVALFDAALTQQEITSAMVNGLGSITAVSPGGKAAVLWGGIKSR